MDNHKFQVNNKKQSNISEAKINIDKPNVSLSGTIYLYQNVKGLINLNSQFLPKQINLLFSIIQNMNHIIKKEKRINKFL